MTPADANENTVNVEDEGRPTLAAPSDDELVRAMRTASSDLRRGRTAFAFLVVAGIGCAIWSIELGSDPPLILPVLIVVGLIAEALICAVRAAARRSCFNAIADRRVTIAFGPLLELEREWPPTRKSRRTPARDAIEALLPYVAADDVRDLSERDVETLCELMIGCRRMRASIARTLGLSRAADAGLFLERKSVQAEIAGMCVRDVGEIEDIRRDLRAAAYPPSPLP
jgi:hypothetical protein